MNDDDLFNCDGCGDILELDVVHDCPVLGANVLLTDASQQLLVKESER